MDDDDNEHLLYYNNFVNNNKLFINDEEDSPQRIEYIVENALKNELISATKRRHINSIKINLDLNLRVIENDTGDVLVNYYDEVKSNIEKTLRIYGWKTYIIDSYSIEHDKDTFTDNEAYVHVELILPLTT